jgi:hypothetical protein
MKNLNPLYEFSPGDLWLSIKGMVPHFKAATNTLKNSTQIVKGAVQRHGKKALMPAIGRQVEKHIIHDPTLTGSTIRNLERVRQGAGFKILQSLPPLPTPDTQSITQIKNTFTKSNRQKMGRVARKAISRPIKTMDDFITNRASLGTLTDSPLLMFPGYGVYSNPMYIPSQVNNLKAGDVRNMIKNTKDYYIVKGKNFFNKFKKS